MRILITGINGFIGHHLATSLIKRGHAVTGIGRNKTCQIDAVTDYYFGSVLDKSLVSRAVSGADVVVHLAALTAHSDIILNKFETLDINLTGTKNVLDAFRESETTKKFLYSSTGKVYGKITELPISENMFTNPQNILGKSKLIVEKLIDFYNDNKKEFIVFRIFNIYGKKQKENFLIPTILKQISQDASAITLGDIEARRDYVHIDDVVNAFVLAIEKTRPPGLSTYNICTGKAVSAREIVEIIKTLKSIQITIKQNLSLVRNDESKEEYGSYQKAKEDFGWEPTIDMTSGLEKLLQ